MPIPRATLVYQWNVLTGEVILSSGRRLLANQGFISVNHRGELATGYDQLGPSDLTKKEREELADYMLDMWRYFREHEHPTMD